MKIFVGFLCIIAAIRIIGWITGVIYIVTKGRVFVKFYHDILEWHLPREDEEDGFDGCSFCNHCKICGKSIMQDSQGNWF